MKLQTLIISGAAAFALLAPAAGAAGNKSARHVGAAQAIVSHRVVKHKTKTAHKNSKSAKKITVTATVKPVPSKGRTVPYIYVPGPVTPAPPFVDPNECQDSGTNCTDQQLCDFWGENCGSLPAPNPIDPTATDTTTSTAPTAG